MTVLVSGGAGFIGSHTVDVLLEKGYLVRILDCLAPPVHLDGHVPDYVPLDDVELVRGDVRDRAAWEEALEGVEAVYHLAAYQDYLPDFSTFFHVNTVGTALLYELIVEKNLPVAKVIVASSQATYGEATYRCSNDQCSIKDDQYPPLREEAQLRRGVWDVKCPACGEPVEPQWTDEERVQPHNQYAMSKYTQEMVALNLGRRYGVPTVAMRYSITQGPRQSFRNAYSGVLRIFAQRLVNGKAPVCYEDGQQLRDYVSVYDVARANLLVLEDEQADYQVLNVGGDRKVNVLDYAHLIAQRAGVDIEPQVPGFYRFGDTRHVFSDVGKLKALGWEPQVGLEEIVDGYIAWARAQPDFRDYSSEALTQMERLGTVRAASGARGTA
ncbi:NAD-dependent epimerase/dehydratase family protein [Chloroflexota bacterium]